MFITYSRVWINRVRLSILLVVSEKAKMNISLSPFAPENLVSRDMFGCPVPRQVYSSATIRLDLVLTRGIPPAFRSGIHSLILPTAIGSVPES